jgi:4-diphosphocytidyl-2-C-methyl-D-erythritol kinase
MRHHPVQQWPAPAKINRFLHITGRREDGYHLLQSVFQLVDWCDWLTFELTDKPAVELSCNQRQLANADNLVVRAARLLRQSFHIEKGVSIHLQKALPAGAGLGGGSSDAATTLRVLNHMWGHPASTEDLLALALQLGADVPFFIRGESAFVEGIGEKVQPMPVDDYHLVLVWPTEAMATGSVFAAPELKRDSTPIDKTSLPTPLGTFGRNDCQAVVAARSAGVAKALEWLGQFAPARMTGTGSCVFAMFDNESKARKIAARCPAGLQARATRTLQRTPLQLCERCG